MDTIQYNQLLSFIWNIASDVLVNVFEKGDYKKVIMPFLVLRRIDVLLEPTKQEVIEKKKWIDEHGLTTSQDEILFKVTRYPFYNTSNFTLRILKSEGDPKQLHKHFIEYLDGFSSDVIDIIDKFKLKQLVENLTDAERLGSIIDKFTDERYNLSNKPILDDNDKVVQPALDNHTMGTIFEELLRRFNEENNVTEAGEHFTPRDYVKLMADLAVMPVADKITDNTYHIYDAACGTGGILTIAQERIEEIAREHGKQVQVKIFGQEQQPDTYATCKAELMISGHIKSFHYQLGTEQKDYIAYDSTLSRDGHKGETFDFCISNPPFGIPWKEDLKKWGIDEKKKKEINDTRFIVKDENEEDYSFIPNIDDSQMLFLANNISRMREDTVLGTRIVEVHDGSSLFSGDAGSGPSNLRKYIIENDLLEAIIAMPENNFYNTGIGTYIWILSNKKEPRRKGLIQLIDATGIKTPLRKNLGKKNCESTKTEREQILKLLMDFQETSQSKIFSNEEFGYWSIKVYQPKRDEHENVIRDKDGNPIINKKTKEIEIVPLNYKGGIDGFIKKEILPYAPDTLIDTKSIVKGYELSFAKYFWEPKDMDSLGIIKKRIVDIKERTEGLLEEIISEQDEIANVITKGVNSNVKMKFSGKSWIGMIPEHWELRRLSQVSYEHFISNKNVHHPNLLSLSYGKIIRKDINTTEGLLPASFDTYQIVENGNIVLRLTDLQNDQKSLRVGLAKEEGIVTSAYVCLGVYDSIIPDYLYYILHSYDIKKLFYSMGGGIRQGLNWQGLKKIDIPLPPIDEQRDIVKYIENKCLKIDKLVMDIQAEIDNLKEYKQRLIADRVTGQLIV